MIERTDHDLVNKYANDIDGHDKPPPVAFKDSVLNFMARDVEDVDAAELGPLAFPAWREGDKLQHMTSDLRSWGVHFGQAYWIHIRNDVVINVFLHRER